MPVADCSYRYLLSRQLHAVNISNMTDTNTAIHIFDIPTNWQYVSFSDAKAVRIIWFNEQTMKLNLDKRALDSVLKHSDAKNLPVAILSIAGAFRKGKSFLLSFCLRYLQYLVSCSSQTAALSRLVGVGKTEPWWPLNPGSSPLTSWLMWSNTETLVVPNQP